MNISGWDWSYKPKVGDDQKQMEFDDFEDFELLDVKELEYSDIPDSLQKKRAERKLTPEEKAIEAQADKINVKIRQLAINLLDENLNELPLADFHKRTTDFYDKVSSLLKEIKSRESLDAQTYLLVNRAKFVIINAQEYHIERLATEAIESKFKNASNANELDNDLKAFREIVAHFSPEQTTKLKGALSILATEFKTAKTAHKGTGAIRDVFRENIEFLSSVTPYLSSSSFESVMNFMDLAIIAKNPDKKPQGQFLIFSNKNFNTKSNPSDQDFDAATNKLNEIIGFLNDVNLVKSISDSELYTIKLVAAWLKISYQTRIQEPNNRLRNHIDPLNVINLRVSEIISQKERPYVDEEIIHALKHLENSIEKNYSQAFWENDEIVNNLTRMSPFMKDILSLTCKEKVDDDDLLLEKVQKYDHISLYKTSDGKDYVIALNKPETYSEHLDWQQVARGNKGIGAVYKPVLDASNELSANFERLLALIPDEERRPNITISGFGLNGATAQWLAYQNKEKMSQSKLSVCAFGTPACFDIQASNTLRDINTINFRYDGDVLANAKSVNLIANTYHDRNNQELIKFDTLYKYKVGDAWNRGHLPEIYADKINTVLSQIINVHDTHQDIQNLLRPFENQINQIEKTSPYLRKKFDITKNFAKLAAVIKNRKPQNKFLSVNNDSKLELSQDSYKINADLNQVCDQLDAIAAILTKPSWVNKLTKLELYQIKFVVSWLRVTYKTRPENSVYGLDLHDRTMGIIDKRITDIIAEKQIKLENKPKNSYLISAFQNLSKNIVRSNSIEFLKNIKDAIPGILECFEKTKTFTVNGLSHVNSKENLSLFKVLDKEQYVVVLRQIPSASEYFGSGQTARGQGEGAVWTSVVSAQNRLKTEFNELLKTLAGKHQPYEVVVSGFGYYGAVAQFLVKHKPPKLCQNATFSVCSFASPPCFDEGMGASLSDIQAINFRLTSDACANANKVLQNPTEFTYTDRNWMTVFPVFNPHHVVSDIILGQEHDPVIYGDEALKVVRNLMEINSISEEAKEIGNQH